VVAGTSMPGTVGLRPAMGTIPKPLPGVLVSV